MKSRYQIFSVLGLMAVAAVILAVFVWPNSRFVYYRYFDNYRFGIEIGGEIDANQNRHRTINTSYYDPPALMYGVGTFRIPDTSDFKFETIHDEANSLFCVYDTNGWGYIAIVNTETDEYFSSTPLPNFTADTIEWRDEFDLLKLKHPKLPYIEIFENAAERSENSG